ncbi:hypothetical protein Dimus_007717 [Dionaea muscipula]
MAYTFKLNKVTHFFSDLLKWMLNSISLQSFHKWSMVQIGFCCDRAGISTRALAAKSPAGLQDSSVAVAVFLGALMIQQNPKQLGDSQQISLQNPKQL